MLPVPPTLALVVIARDEAPRIARLLDSAAPWVDRMVVLDTGSADDTADIARACGATVQQFAWCDDFAAARNAALDMAAADWHLVLDADEWIIDGGVALRGIASEAPGFVGVLALDDRDASGAVVRDWLSRLLPGTLRYAGRIHEQPRHRLPLRRVPVVVGHDGYSAANLQAKRGRNRRMLQAELARSPGDAYLWFQLGKDHAAYGEFGDAATALLQADALAAALPGPTLPWQADLSTRLIFALKRCGEHPQALAHAERRMAACSDSPDFHFALGDLLLDWAAAAPAEAATLLALARDAWQRCLQIGERPDQTGSVAGRGSHLAAHNLAVIAPAFAAGAITSA